MEVSTPHIGNQPMPYNYNTVGKVCKYLCSVLCYLCLVYWIAAVVHLRRLRRDSLAMTRETKSREYQNYKLST